MEAPGVSEGREAGEMRTCPTCAGVAGGICDVLDDSMSSTVPAPPRIMAVALVAPQLWAASSPCAALSDRLLGAGMLMAFAVVAPVEHLLALIAIAIVPYEIQNALSFGGGAGARGAFIATC
jgi:hypothetical protein